MQATRSLRQPGPRHPSRIDCCRGTPIALQYSLIPGATLNEAITSPLVEAGFQCGTVTFRDIAVDPFRYVMPGPADDDTHVAYFTAPRSPHGITRIERANATFGWADGKPSVHCHAVWTEPDGSRRGGHIIANETIVAGATVAETIVAEPIVAETMTDGPGRATAWGFRDVRIDTRPDPETNFTLFQPAGSDPAGSGLVARVKPNEDILAALEAIARRHDIANAVVRGSLGSLIGACFADGTQVDDHATEVLVREGHIRDGVAALDLLVVDMRGEVHQGWLRHGENPVCITFDLFIEDAA